MTKSSKSFNTYYNMQAENEIKIECKFQKFELNFDILN